MNASEALNYFFDYEHFQLGQEAVIHDLNQGRDVLLTLPTGAGKSICYQLPALMNEGLTIVVTPLLSLMEDQIRHLRSFGVKSVAALNSFNTKEQRQDVLKKLATLKILYISPELLQQQWILKRLRALPISFFVVDEAHCISQWGHEFRPDYMRLEDVLKSLSHPTLLLVTATLTSDVKRDILRHFSSRTLVEHLHVIDRDNISFVVEKLASAYEKDRYLVQCLTTYHVPTIIYFSSKKEVERVTEMLHVALAGHRVAYYHGDLENKERMLIQQQFLTGDLDVICATSAFGMGVNKKDVRLVIHYHLPTQIESFVQEVGRAGRDQHHSVSIVLMAENDWLLAERLIENEMIEEHILDDLFQTLAQQAVFDEAAFFARHDLNDILRRYIKNYLDNHQVIADNNSIVHSKLSTTFKLEWKEILRRRQQFKRKKLFELMRALNNSSCIRQAVYKPFQTTTKSARFGCCSHCGFMLETFLPIQIETPKHHVLWEDKLKQKLCPHR